MNKIISFVVLLALFMAIPVVSYGQEGESSTKSPAPETSKEAAREETKASHMKMHGKHGMMSMMKKMMCREMVAASDGGVIIMTPHKLLKYDKNLNLLKETKLDIGKECMMKMMEEKGKCPMCGADLEKAEEKTHGR